jgi:hypothetical protein
MRRIQGAMIVASLCAAPALAEPPPAPVNLAYHVFFAGFDVADMHASLALTPTAYRVQLGYQLTGGLGAMFHGQGESSSDGRFTEAGAQPHELFSRGAFGGRWHVTQIDYHGDQPVFTQLQPPVEKDRDPVPSADQAGSIDSLSAMAVLLHTVWTTGRCDGVARTFDGRWLSRIDVHTAGQEVLPPTDRSPFHGPALRCDVEGHQLAGFVHDADEATLHRAHHASVWFAALAPGQKPVPVRIAIETRGFGEAVIYLVAEP